MNNSVLILSQARDAQDAIVTAGVIALCYASLLVLMFRYAAARTPAGIVRRLHRGAKSVVVTVNVFNSSTWDPSRPLGHGGFYAHGRATYTLDDPLTVRVRFQPRKGDVVERSAPINRLLLPETPQTRRRRLVARLVIALYLVVGGAAFAVTAALVDATASVRLRLGALSGLAAIAIAWLITHLVLTRPRRRHPAPTVNGDDQLPVLAASRHLLGWALGFLIAVAVLGVAWRLGNLDQPHPMSWASAFLSAGIFVLVSAAALSATLHHHAYIHHDVHRDHPPRPLP